LAIGDFWQKGTLFICLLIVGEKLRNSVITAGQCAGCVCTFNRGILVSGNCRLYFTGIVAADQSRSLPCLLPYKIWSCRQQLVYKKPNTTRLSWNSNW